MCIKDLQERFARIELHVSEPLVAFRESVFLHSEAPDVALKPPRVSVHIMLWAYELNTDCIMYIWLVNFCRQPSVSQPAGLSDTA